MATVAMALSVYKRFQMFPCIIQNNPLFFYRKPDPKVTRQTKVIAACLDSAEVRNLNWHIIYDLSLVQNPNFNC